jgi:hypothetical protein
MIYLLMVFRICRNSRYCGAEAPPATIPFGKEQSNDDANAAHLMQYAECIRLFVREAEG